MKVEESTMLQLPLRRTKLTRASVMSDLGDVLIAGGTDMAAYMGFGKSARLVNAFLGLVFGESDTSVQDGLDEISAQIADLATQLESVEEGIEQIKWSLEEGFADAYIAEIDPRYLTMTYLLESDQTPEVLQKTYNDQIEGINSAVFNAAHGLYEQLSGKNNLFQQMHENYLKDSVPLSEWYIGLKALLAKYVAIFGKAKVLVEFGAGENSEFNAVAPNQMEQIDWWIGNLSLIVESPMNSGVTSIISPNVALIASATTWDATNSKSSSPRPVSWYSYGIGCVGLNSGSFGCSASSPCVQYWEPCPGSVQPFSFALEYWKDRDEWQILGGQDCVSPTSGSFDISTCNNWNTYYQLYPSSTPGVLLVVFTGYNSGPRFVHRKEAGYHSLLNNSPWTSIADADSNNLARWVFAVR